MVSSYYTESVQRGAEFQQQNKSWDGKDTFSYHRQIRDKPYNPTWMNNDTTR